MEADTLLWIYFYSVILITVFLSLYGVYRRPNVLKKIIMLSIFGDAANVLAVLMGFKKNAASPPVYPGQTFSEWSIPNSTQLQQFASAAVDPVPQVLVVTAIVIGLAVLIFLSAAAILLYRHYGTLDVRLIRQKICEGGVEE